MFFIYFSCRLFYSIPLEILFNNVFYSAFLKLYRESAKDTQINMTTSSRYDYLYDKIINVLDEKNMRLKVYHTYDYDAVQ